MDRCLSEWSISARSDSGNTKLTREQAFGDESSPISSLMPAHMIGAADGTASSYIPADRKVGVHEFRGESSQVLIRLFSKQSDDGLRAVLHESRHCMAVIK
jgi:hypothetical protein